MRVAGARKRNTGNPKSAERAKPKAPWLLNVDGSGIDRRVEGVIKVWGVLLLREGATVNVEEGEVQSPLLLIIALPLERCDGEAAGAGWNPNVPS
jgi:hypothetical protein